MVVPAVSPPGGSTRVSVLQASVALTVTMMCAMARTGARTAPCVTGSAELHSAVSASQGESSLHLTSRWKLFILPINKIPFVLWIGSLSHH